MFQKRQCYVLHVFDELFVNQIKENCEKIVLDFLFLSNIHNNPMF